MATHGYLRKLDDDLREYYVAVKYIIQSIMFANSFTSCHGKSLNESRTTGTKSRTVLHDHAVLVLCRGDSVLQTNVNRGKDVYLIVTRLPCRGRHEWARQPHARSRCPAVEACVSPLRSNNIHCFTISKGHPSCTCVSNSMAMSPLLFHMFLRDHNRSFGYDSWAGASCQ